MIPRRVKNLLWSVAYRSWPSNPGLLPGYTLLLTVPPDLPVFLRLAVEICRRQDQTGLVETLVIPDHPIRAKIEEGLETLAQALLHEPAMQEKVAKLKDEVLANPAMSAWIDGMWERSRAGLLRAVRNPQGLMTGSLGASVAQLGRTLVDDARLQLLVNRFARRTLVGAVSRYGDAIVRIVSETVKRWDARTVTGRIEGAVGRDLQFIRINGTLVGGLVGVLIHTVDRLL